MGQGEERHGLASPRFRRRLVKGGSLLAVVGVGALISVFYWNTANPVETPLSNTPADVYVPNLPVTFAAAERRQVIKIAARFVDTAVRRDHTERAYELAGPSLRNGTTRQHWLDGDIPVVPYPVDAARWKFDYSYADEIGLQVAVFPQADAAMRPMVFNMSLRAIGEGVKRRWLVETWSPRGGGGGSTARPNRGDGSPFRIDVPQGSASTNLGAAWLLLPAGLIALALIVPATLVVVERTRSRRAQRAYQRSL